jgi:hypothetical protein
VWFKFIINQVGFLGFFVLELSGFVVLLSFIVAIFG